MSHGRDPHYIYACVCDGTYEGEPNGHPSDPHVAFAAGGTAVRWTELEQFVASLHWRGELAAVIDRGYALPGMYLRREEARTPPFSKPRRPPGW